MGRAPLTDDPRRAAEVLASGGLVALPTESWYGLAADITNGEAVDRVYRVKERQRDQPLLVLIDHPDRLAPLVAGVPDVWQELIRRVWPGPLTLIFAAASDLDPRLTGGTGTIGIRCTSHPAAAEIIRLLGRPVTGTSANLSGQPPSRDPREVALTLGQRIDLVFDGGLSPGGAGSTIIRAEAGQVHCLRQGQIPMSEISKYTGIEAGHQSGRESDE